MKNSELNEHQPVLLEEVLRMAAECPRPPKSYLDVTFGRGGHLSAMLKRFPELKAVALDQDEQAILWGRQHLSQHVDCGRLQLIQGNFVDATSLLPEAYQGPHFDFVLADLGVSSPQLDEKERGFSFYHSGPLDMRMNRHIDLTADEIINNASARELNQLFFERGEIARPQRVVWAILQHRRKQRIETTTQLAGIIEQAEGWRRKGHHPATRYFLALRLKVNNELGVLEDALPSLIRLLRPGGRLVVLTFHSAEDRIAKNIFRSQERFGHRVNKKVIKPDRNETLRNPRSRSAKLRAFQKEGE